MTFTVPVFVLGDGQRFRLSASQVASRDSGFTCPMGLALSARLKAGAVQPNDVDRWRSQFDKASTLNFAIRDLYYELAHGADTEQLLRNRKDLTHAQQRFARHALDQLAELIPEASADTDVALTLGEDVVADTHVGELAGEVTVFGPHLQSEDASVHEVTRLRIKQLPPLGRDADADWVAVAALALAYSNGVPSTARVRVSEFSLASGKYRCVFDGSREDTTALYAERGRPLRAALNEVGFSPGAGCSGCAFLNVCPAVPQRRGVLGIPRRAVATRHLTSADLHAYDRCPTAFLAQRRDHLPDGYVEDFDQSGADASRQRGTAVHEWLSWAHSRVPTTGCTENDLPDPSAPGAPAAATAAGLDMDAYRTARPYLVQHLTHCPCGFDGLEDWATERRVVIFDPDADIVAISTPDLVCTVTGTGEPIWRETKTSSSVPPDVEAALYRYPGFAYNIALLAAEVPRTYATAHAELEVLAPTSSEVFYVSLTDGALVSLAQKIVADIARRYATDLRFERQPHGGCPSCPVHRWCDPPLTAEEAAPRAPDTDDDEFAGIAEPF